MASDRPQPAAMSHMVYRVRHLSAKLNHVFSTAVPVVFMFCHWTAHSCMRACDADGSFSKVPGPSLITPGFIGSSAALGGAAGAEFAGALGCGDVCSGDAGAACPGASIDGRCGGRGVGTAGAKGMAHISAGVIKASAATSPQTRIAALRGIESRAAIGASRNAALRRLWGVFIPASRSWARVGSVRGREILAVLLCTERGSGQGSDESSLKL